MNEKQIPRTGDAGDSEEARDDLRLASTEKTARTLAGKFPAARSLGGKSVWVEAEVEAWIKALPLRKYKDWEPAS